MGKIYTHASKAHADEMLACAILLAVHPEESFEIHRVFGEKDLPQDLGERDFIVDIGMSHDGERRFDHHQEDGDVQGHCAATLVAKRFAPKLPEDPAWRDFLGRVSTQDNHGIKAVEESFGGARLGSLLMLEWKLVSQFEKSPLAIATLVSEMIKDSLNHIETVEIAKFWVSQNTQVVMVGQVKALVLHHDPRIDGVDPAAVNAATGAMLDREGIHVSVSFDPRNPAGEVRTVFRTRNGEGVLDFNFARPSNPVFCHKAGFLLNFVPQDEREWEQIVSDSIVG